MIVEVVAVGTELLLGQIVNGNAAAIGRRLAEQGFDVHHQVAVGDNLTRLEGVLRNAMRRAGAVVITGGIGPTPDDLTREAICAATDRPMRFSEDYADRLERRWAASGRVMPENNLRQAEHPDGAELLPNPKGTAPGLALHHGGVWLFALPGVPAEMEALLDAEVMPRLRAAAGEEGVLVSRLLRTWGRSESQVAEMLDDLFHASANPSVAFLASSGEIKVRITAKAGSAAFAQTLIEPVEAEVRSRLGASVFGTDDDTIGAVLIADLAARGWTMGTVESATAGMVAAAITATPGSSAVFRGGIVAYATDLKTDLVGVPAGLIEASGAVSENTALAMAEAGAVRLGADVVVAVTGSAGPEPQEQPAGTMIVAVRTPRRAAARTLRMPGDRERVRTYTTTAALHLARLAVQGEWWGR